MSGWGDEAAVYYFTFWVLFIVLTSIGIYLKVRHNKNRLMFWIAAVIVCCGLVGLQVILEKQVIPRFDTSGDTQVSTVLLYLTGALNIYVNCFPYYAVLIFYLLFNGFMKYDRWLISGLSIPIWITLFSSSNLSVNYLDTTFLSLWGLIYMLCIFYLAIFSVVIEKDPRYRIHHLIIAIIICIPIAVLNVFHFASSKTSDRILIVIPYILAVSLLLIILLYVRGAFLGVRKKSLQTIHISTVLTQHSLKNSIGKIKLNTVNIRNSLENKQYDHIDTYVSNLLNIHDTMMKTMSNISRAVSDHVVLQKEEVNINDIVSEAIKGLGNQSNITIEIDCSPVSVVVDRMLLTECLHNICNNALEAMQEAGTLRIKLLKRRKKIHLLITDTGCGMNKLQVHNVFEPFYSSKQRTRDHFGLGMYQAKKVIDAHDGKIEIKSAIGKGTTVIVTLKTK